MDSGPAAVVNNSKDVKEEEELSKRAKRAHLKELNILPPPPPSKSLDSSLKRHTALIKRMRLSIGLDNRDQILKDIDTLSLEKYVDEIAGAAIEGVGRCKTEKDVWSAVEVISAMHRRFPASFTPAIVGLLAAGMAVPSRATLSALTPEQREKEDASRVSRQRPLLRVCSELAMVGIIRDAPNRSGGEWIMKVIKDLLSGDPTLSSLPLLSTFLKSYSRPFLGIMSSAAKQISSATEPGSLSSGVAEQEFPKPGEGINEDDELIEKDTRDRFRKMCEGYFETVSKKLVKEHNRLQDQDRRNHEAYIRSGEIFEDRQQAYEKMTKSYEKLLVSCQTLSDLLNIPLPPLPTMSQKSDSILLSSSNTMQSLQDDESAFATGGKWEDEEERKFYEDLIDLGDFVPKVVLGVEDASAAEKDNEKANEDKEKDKREEEEAEVRRLEKEIEDLTLKGESTVDESDVPTPVATPPRSPTPTEAPSLAAVGPSQLLTALLTRLPDATNRSLIDQAAVDFAFLNSKAARKRLVKFLGQVPKNRTDLLPHYSRLVATLTRYMPDIGTELVQILEEEFRYLQRKKNVVKELTEVRLKNVSYISALTKFRVVPAHLILHIFKVYLDDFSGVNVENVALLLEGCGRFLLRSDETREKMTAMVELMRRKQSMQHFDTRQQLLLENAYYQCNPPERAAREEKQRSPMELFIRHLIHDVLVKKTIDKVLRLVRKLDWENAEVVSTLHKVFTKPWKVKYGNVNLLAMLTYDLQRYHPAFTVAVVDQVLEDVRRGLETNVFKSNQRRIATVKYLGELYIYRLIGSGIIFDALWSLVTFGHPDGRPLPGQPCPIDAPDDFFRVRLVCTLLDTCGMCFDRGSQKKKLDNFLTFFQMYVLCKESTPMDVEFMITDSLEALRPKLVLFKTFEEAALAVDEMFNSVVQTSGGVGDGDDSDRGEESGEDDRHKGDEDDDEGPEETGPVDRPGSPDAVVVLNAHENLGPSEEAEAEFDKELAKMMVDTSAESRKVDRKTALALWDSSVLPGGVRKKRTEEEEDAQPSESEKSGPGMMKFTMLTKRGNKHQTRDLGIPSTSALAMHTRSAQLQDKVEQQQLKQLVLNYEQTQEIEEQNAFEATMRNRGIRVRYGT